MQTDSGRDSYLTHSDYIIKDSLASRKAHVTLIELDVRPRRVRAHLVAFVSTLGPDR